MNETKTGIMRVYARSMSDSETNRLANASIRNPPPFLGYMPTDNYQDFRIVELQEQVRLDNGNIVWDTIPMVVGGALYESICRPR